MQHPRVDWLLGGDKCLTLFVGLRDMDAKQKKSVEHYIEQAEAILDRRDRENRDLTADEIALAGVYASLAQARGIDDVGSVGITVDVERFPQIG